MAHPLSKKKVEELSKLLTPDQKEFMDTRAKQSKKSKWIEALARMKGISLAEELSYEEMEQLIDDWILLDILDSGIGSRDYRCECGRPLRYQYIVQHKKEGKTSGLGSKCFEHHTSLPAEVVKDILDGFHKIDLERDEILLKLERNDIFDLSPYIITGNKPSDYMEQYSLGLPLTENQQKKVYVLWEEFKRQSRIETILATLTPEQKGLYEGLKSEEQEELVEKLADEIDYYTDNQINDIPQETLEGEIHLFIASGLPLLDRQLEAIRKARYEFRRRLRRNYREVREQPVTFPNTPKINWISNDTVDIQKLLELHLPLLKTIREKEADIPPGLLKDWVYMQELVRKGLKGEEIDYSSFKSNLMNLSFALHIN